MKNKSRFLFAGLALVATVISAEAAKPVAKPNSSKPLTFEQADLDANGGLSVMEFARTQGPGTQMVQVRKRFLAIDVTGAFETVIDPATGLPAVDPATGLPVVGPAIPDGLVTQEELAAYKLLPKKPKITLTRFELADFSGDGMLSAVEFGYLVSQKVPFRNVQRNFDRLDVNLDGLLTLDEFNRTKPAV